jgi:hypothetical protein
MPRPSPAQEHQRVLRAAVMELEQQINSLDNLDSSDIGSVVMLKDGTKILASKAYRIAYEGERRLVLLREWSLFDSMLCSSYVEAEECVRQARTKSSGRSSLLRTTSPKSVVPTPPSLPHLLTPNSPQCRSLVLASWARPSEDAPVVASSFSRGGGGLRTAVKG